MALCLLDDTERIPSWELFASSLREHTYDPSSNDIRFSFGITLNVHNLSEPYLSELREDPELRESPDLVISHKGIRKIILFRKSKPRTQYSFYGGSTIQDISGPDLRELVKGRMWILNLRDGHAKSTVFLCRAQPSCSSYLAGLSQLER